MSPRNAGIAADLAARFPNVTLCSSNASVVEHVDTVVLAVRPQDAATALDRALFEVLARISPSEAKRVAESQPSVVDRSKHR